MDNEALKLILEDQDIPPEKIDEIVEILSPGVDKAVDNPSDHILELQRKIDETDDWRKKARLAARIISVKLD